jgi:hypothetical protein
MLRTFAVTAALLCLIGAPLYAADADGPGQKKLQARITRLIVELGDDDYDTREAAHAALLEVGRPAFKALEAATKDKDLERVWRAKELVGKINLLPHPSKVDRNCTNGYMPVYGKRRQTQTFKLAADLKLEAIRFRPGRTMTRPNTLKVELHQGDKPGDKPLAAFELPAEWKSKAGGVTGVARYFKWVERPMKAELKKGRTYCLVFGSALSGNEELWLINCLYRDTFAAGTHRRADGGKVETLGKYDLMIELKSGGKTVLSTVPGKVKLKEQEHFGLGHTGIDLGRSAGTVGQGAFQPR